MKKSIACYLIVLIFLSLQLIANVAFAKANTLDVSLIDQSPILLSSYLSVLEDSTGVLTLDDIQKEDIAPRFQTDFPAEKPLTMSYTSSAYWLRLQLKNSGDKPISRMLNVDYPLLANLDFYFQTEQQNHPPIHTGYSKPFENRAYKSRSFAFPIFLPEHSNNVIYFRVETPNSMIIPISLWESTDFYLKNNNDDFIQSIYIFIVIAIAMLNFFFAVFFKELNYFLYFCMTMFFALLVIFGRGFGSELLWLNSTWLTCIGSMFFASFAVIFQLLFIRRILDVPTLAPKIDLAFKLLISLHFVTAILLLFTFQFAKYIIIIFIMSAILSLIVSIIGVLKQQRHAYFVFAAFSILSIGIIEHATLLIGIIPINNFTIYFSQICLLLKLLIFSFLLAL